VNQHPHGHTPSDRPGGAPGQHHSTASRGDRSPKRRPNTPRRAQEAEKTPTPAASVPTVSPGRLHAG
jgi:hypothetical protein